MTTPQQRGASNRAKGARAERAVVAWLRANGFPHAERAVRTGYASRARISVDPGDIVGTPGIVWQVTDRGDFTKPSVLARRMADTEQQRAGARADYGVLVHRKRGTRDVGEWVAYLPREAAIRLGWHAMPGGRRNGKYAADFPVSMPLRIVVDMLRRAGYGEPLTEDKEAS